MTKYYSTYDKIEMSRFIKEAKMRLGWTIASIDGANYNLTDKKGENIAVVRQSKDGHVILEKHGNNKVDDLLTQFDMGELI